MRMPATWRESRRARTVPCVHDKILLTGFTPDRDRPLESLDAFVDFAGRHAELGFTDIVIHWPIPDSNFEADEKVFEQIAMEAPVQLGHA
jgi:hypothetical protein